MSHIRWLIALPVAVLLAGCAQDPISEPEPEEELGYSVRHMVRAQTFNPQAGKTAQPPAGMDGARAETALEGYRSAEPVVIRDSSTGARQVWTQQQAEPAK